MDSETFSIENKDLIARAESGDEAALAELFAMAKPRLRKIVSVRMSPMLRGRVDPSDVLQEAFLDLNKKLPNFKTKNLSMFVWMRMVAAESVINAHREHVQTQKRNAGREMSLRQKNHGESSICLAGQLMGKYTSVFQNAVRQEIQSKLLAAIDEMSEADREIILMRIFEGLSNQEAAEALELSANGASNRFVRALGRLKSSLEQIPGFSEGIKL